MRFQGRISDRRSELRGLSGTSVIQNSNVFVVWVFLVGLVVCGFLNDIYLTVSLMLKLWLRWGAWALLAFLSFGLVVVSALFQGGCSFLYVGFSVVLASCHV